MVAIMLKHRDSIDAPAGQNYVKALAARLMVEPRAVAIACCDPVHGLVSEIFVRPVIADIARWCARHSEEAHLMVADDDRRWREERDRECDRSNRETVEELRARLGPTFGLKGIDKLDRIRGDTRAEEDEEAAKQRQAEANAQALAASSRDIAADYARRGMETVTTGGEWDLPVSPALAAQLGRPGTKARKRRKAA